MSLFPRNDAGASSTPLSLLDRLQWYHKKFTPWQERFAIRRKETLAAAHADLSQRPDHQRNLGGLARGDWKIKPLPEWLLDQRNQMTGNVDSAELSVKLLNSGSPAVMLDLEDSMANTYDCTSKGVQNAIAALHGELTYTKDGGPAIGIKPSNTVTFVRARGLHMSQHGIFDEPMSASVFDVVSVISQLDPAKLKHPPCVYIPKTESATEALFWKELFQELARDMGQPDDWIKCMALVESHPFAYQLEEFAYLLRDHLVGLNLGRWDYMASLAHWNLSDPEWILPDRDTIPSEVEFFQRLRYLIVETCHKHGMLAIGGMTALFPDRKNPELNDIALNVLTIDKANESKVGMDGAWTGHPDQNEIAVKQFPEPNQLQVRYPDRDQFPDLRPVPKGVGTISEAGTRRAIRGAIEYRAGVLAGKGASLIRRPSDGAPVMEDLATDRIFRVMIAQRIKHGVHTTMEVIDMFFEEVYALGATETIEEAASITLEMIMSHEFDPC